MAGYRGFSLMEVVIGLVILLTLAAMALPTLGATLDRARVESAAAQLEVVRDALYKPSGSAAFYQVIGANAGRLSELSSPIVANNASYATGTDDSCGNAFSTKEANRWDNEGPYVNFTIDRDSGMATPIGTAADSMTRVPNSSDPGVLLISFPYTVTQEDAELLDGVVDGGNGSLAGTVRWQLPAVDGMVRMSYVVPINDAC